MRTLLFLLLFPLVCFSQTYSIEYEVTLRSLERKGQLVFNQNHTSYYYEKLINNEEAVMKTENENTSKRKVTLTHKGDRTRYQIYNKDTLYNYDYIDDIKFLIIEIMPEMNWQLEQEIREIEKFTCNKATVFFRGRKYIAWFTTEIPINLGPWKFSGLPGAILQIYDESGEFSWTASRIETMDLDAPLELNQNLEKITLKEYVIQNEKEQNKQVNAALLKFAGRNNYQEIKSERKRGREKEFEWE